MAGAARALDLPLHPDLRLLAERGRDLLLGADPAPAPARGLPLDRRAAGGHQPLCRRAQRRSRPLRLDQDRRPDHRQAEHSECVSALCLPFAAWNLDHLVAHLAGRGIGMRPAPDQGDPPPARPQVAARGNPVRRAGRPGVRPWKGAIERLGTAAPAGSVVVCLDETGPQAVKSYPGRRLVQAAGRSRGQTRQAQDRPRSARRRRRVAHRGQPGRLPGPGRRLG